MSSRVRELEVNNHALTARLKELQEQLDAQALQNRFSAGFCQPKFNPFCSSGQTWPKRIMRLTS